MKKTILVSSLLVLFAVGMNSCRKCYVCTQTTQETVNNVIDSTVYLKTEVCSGKNGAGSTQNFNAAIQDIEATGYICNEQ